MYRIGVIGDRDSVLGFQALGLEVCPAENAEEARQALHRMAKEEFAILYLTEQLAVQLQPEIARYQELVESTAHLILQFSKEGGVENAAGF